MNNRAKYLDQVFIGLNGDKYQIWHIVEPIGTFWEIGGPSYEVDRIGCFYAVYYYGDMSESEAFDYALSVQNQFDPDGERMVKIWFLPGLRPSTLEESDIRYHKGDPDNCDMTHISGDFDGMGVNLPCSNKATQRVEFTLYDDETGINFSYRIKVCNQCKTDIVDKWENRDKVLIEPITH